MLPPLVPAVLLAAWLAPGGMPSPPRDDPPAPSAIETGLERLAQGDKLANEGNTTEAEIRYQEAMESLLPGIRRLPFKTTVKRDVTPRDKVADYLLDELDEEETPEEQRADELAMKAFGLLPRDFDYRATLMKLMTEQVGAFYDPQTDTMHLILEPKDGRKVSPLEALFGGGGKFNKDTSKTIIAHELTHALADQHYDLDALMKAIEDDDDKSLALAALIEGEATLTMMAAQTEDWKGEETAQLPSEALGTSFRMMGPFLRAFGGAQIGSVPPIMSEPLIFPYLQGVVFNSHLTNKDGWKAIDAAYAAPPLSTEQVIHPEKYRDEPDAPTEVDLGTLTAPEGWKELTRNVLGELQISILLARQNGRAAAEGWDGDRYALFEGPDGQLGLVWRSTWDTPEDAAAFARAFARYRRPTYGDDVPAKPETLQGEADGRASLIQVRGPDVVVVENLPAAAAATLAEDAWKATLREKTQDPKPTATP